MLHLPSLFDRYCLQLNSTGLVYRFGDRFWNGRD